MAEAAALNDTNRIQIDANNPNSLQYTNRELNPNHPHNQMLGRGFENVWAVIDKTGFDPYSDVENNFDVPNPNDFHLVKNAMVYAFGQLGGKENDAIVHSMFRAEIDTVNLARMFQTVIDVNEFINYMHGYLTSADFLYDQERWNKESEDANLHHVGKVMYHILNTINPQFVEEKKAEHESDPEERFRAMRNEALSRLRNANNLDECRAAIIWSDEQQHIFEQLKRTIVNAEKAKEFLSPEAIEALKPLDESEEFGEKLLQKQSLVNKEFAQIYENLLGEKKRKALVELKHEFMSSLLDNPITDFNQLANLVGEDGERILSDEEIEAIKHPRLGVKNGSAISVELTAGDKEQIRLYISKIKNYAIVDPADVEEFKSFSSKEAKQYVAWFSDVYLKAMQLKFDKDRLQQIEDLDAVQMAFENGDWRDESKEKEVAAVVLAGAAGSGKSALKLKTTSSGTDGVAGGGPRHKHLLGLSAIWDIAREDGRGNFHLLGGGIFAAQLLGHIDSKKATALDGYPRDVAQAKFLKNPIFGPKSIKFIQTEFGWSREAENPRFHQNVLFRYTANRLFDGFNIVKDDSGKIKSIRFNGRSDTIQDLEYVGVNNSNMDVDMFKMIDSLTSRFALENELNTELNDFAQREAFGKFLYDNGIRIKKGSRMEDFRAKAMDMIADFKGSNNQTVEVIRLIVDNLTPAEQYAMIINSIGGPGVMVQNMPGSFDPEKYQIGVGQLIRREV